jgi:hypothetical protein
VDRRSGLGHRALSFAATIASRRSSAGCAAAATLFKRSPMVTGANASAVRAIPVFVSSALMSRVQSCNLGAQLRRKRGDLDAIVSNR